MRPACEQSTASTPPREGKSGKMARGMDEIMDEITIRTARPGDARRIARLDVETWRATYAGILTTQFLVGLSTAARRGVGLERPSSSASRATCGSRSTATAASWASAAAGAAAAGRNSPAKSSPSTSRPTGRTRGSAAACCLALFERLVAHARPAARRSSGCCATIQGGVFYHRVGGREVRSHRRLRGRRQRGRGGRLRVARPAALSRNRGPRRRHRRNPDLARGYCAAARVPFSAVFAGQSNPHFRHPRAKAGTHPIIRRAG